MIRCILVDDETYSLDILENYATRSSEIEVIARCSNIFEMEDVLKRESADLVFLDIQMPQMSGIVALRSPLLKELKIVLVTAYQEYAVEAFELDVVDYLLKPFSFGRFEKAIEKVRTLLPDADLKYARSGIGSKESISLFEEIKIFFMNNKPYLNPDLRLDDLAKQMGVNRNHLSQSINEQGKVAFWNFVNRYRLEEVKKKLWDQGNDHLTIEGLALDSGFNSISTFNALFKKMTGNTPKEFRRLNRS